MNTLAKRQLQEAYELMQASQRILIVAHQKPDGDTSGSSFALRHWLASQGKEVSVFCRHELPDQYAFLPDAHLLTNDPAIFQKEWDLMIVCDSGDLEYAGVSEYLKDTKQRPQIINFDHHASNKLFGDINLVDISASSTAEVVYVFLRENDVDISREIAVCLMTGVFTDTGGFSNAATNQRALEMASHFVQKGVSIPDIHRATIANKSISIMKLWGKIMARLRSTARGVAYTYIFRHDLLDAGISEEAIEGLSNYLSQLKDAKAVIVISERENGMVKVSMRSYHDTVDLAALASAMGGGGHKKAAGFTIPGRLHVQDQSVQIVPA